MSGHPGRSLNQFRNTIGFSISGVSLLVLTGCALSPDISDNDELRSHDTQSTEIASTEADSLNETSVPSTPTELASTSLTELPYAPLDLKIHKLTGSTYPDVIEGKIARQSPVACIDGVKLLVAPAPGALLTSGFGPRNGRNHKGVDYQSKPAGAVVAAAAGEVLIRENRKKDFGNWVVVDHGLGVYTAYAHLASIDKDVREQVTVEQGQTLGVMGKSGPPWIKAIHLHYEIRLGNMKTAGSFFKLDPVDPFTYPESCPALAS